MPTLDLERRWERLLPLSGVAFTVLMVAAAAAFPMPPGGDVSPASKPRWLAEHYNVVIAQSYLRGLAALAFIGLAVAVAAGCRRMLPERSSLPTAALVGGAVSGALTLLAQAVALAAALYVRDGGSPGATRALGSLENGFLDLASVPGVLLFGAVGLTALRGGLPRWFVVLSLVGVPFALLDAVSYDGGPVAAVSILGLAYFLAWSLLAGVRFHLAQAAASTALHTGAVLT